MKILPRLFVLSYLIAVLPTSPATAPAAAPPGKIRYEPTVESLKKYEVPEWFKDAKLGIFMHWGPETVPGFQTCWYARRMYEEGSAVYQFHCATYGHPSKFGYKDVIKLFKPDKFDQAQADRYAELYRRAGARYLVPVAVHHDNFDMWDSKHQPRWNSMAVCGKDVVGMWKKAADKSGLRFGVASHVARTFRWFQTSHGADKQGPLAGVPYDGQDPQYADLYGAPWNSTDPGYEGPNDVGPPQFEKNFEDRMRELIDKYRPDLYYTDGGPPFQQAGYNIVSHLYNENQKWHGTPQAVVTFKGGPIGVENYEFEYATAIMPFYWQTDKTMNSEWYWWRNDTRHYRKGNEIVHTLIDVASKNGNLLLNVPLTPDGELEKETLTMLADMGRYLDFIGEAVFATRPWEVLGEGPRGLNQLGLLTPRDLRFTRNKEGNVLFATIMGWPSDGATVKIKTLGENRVSLQGLEHVSLVGAAGRLAYHQTAEVLEVSLPPKPPFECCAYPIKLTFRGAIPRPKPAAMLLWQAQARSLLPNEIAAAPEGGVLLLDVPRGSAAAKAGLASGDVIRACDGQTVRTVEDLRRMSDQAAGEGTVPIFGADAKRRHENGTVPFGATQNSGQPPGGALSPTVLRKNEKLTVALSDYLYIVSERLESTQSKTVPLASPSAVLPAKVSAGGAVPNDHRALETLLDGKVIRGVSPIFANGENAGMYKLDLGAVRSIAQVNSFAFGRTRARQSFVLYGSDTAMDPGWNVGDATVFTPLVAVDSRPAVLTEYEATSIRRSGGRPLGRYRWLVWAVSPVGGEIGGENTAFAELQVLPAAGPQIK